MPVKTSIKTTVDECSVADREMYLVTAAGRIRCLRCTASSTRTKLQCRKPALKVSRTQKCEFHGGRPHSAETLQRISEANIVHGQ